MYQAIETTFKGPTNSNGSRVLAKAQAGKLMHHWDYGCGKGTAFSDVDANHNAAAKALAEKMGWEGQWVGGAKADGTGNVYVRLDTLNLVPGAAFKVEITR